MDNTFVAESQITINASQAKVWEALTNPDIVKQYLFGTTMKADWRVGGAITYSGEWEGKAYEDKGTILELEPEKRLVTTYWSSASGLEDKPENYKTVTYTVEPSGNGTRITITQNNNDTEEKRDHSKKNWDMVLHTMKEIIEKN